MQQPDQPAVHCPHCAAELDLHMVERVKDNARVSLRIVPEPGAMLHAKTVGGQINAMSGLLTACAREAGADMAVFVERLETDADGAITIGFMMAVRDGGDHAA